MEILIILAYVIVLCILLGIQFFVAKQFEEIAFSKGYGQETHALGMVFFLGIVGMLYVIALPDLNLRILIRENSKESLPDYKTQKGMQENSMDSTSLPYDKNQKSIQENSIKVSTVSRTSNSQYQCKNCGNVVKINQEKCSECNALLSWDNQ